MQRIKGTTSDFPGFPQWPGPGHRLSLGGVVLPVAALIKPLGIGYVLGCPLPHFDVLAIGSSVQQSAELPLSLK